MQNAERTVLLMSHRSYYVSTGYQIPGRSGHRTTHIHIARNDEDEAIEKKMTMNIPGNTAVDKHL